MIIRSNPAGAEELGRVEQAWFDSDASTNEDAIRDIDAEAARHGLVRVNEYWLQKHRLADGRIARRGFCYRPEPTDLIERLEARRRTEPLGVSSGELVREDRAEGD
jgi:predicted polyphosphate/ATP-dependent NAD kinase